MTKDRIVWPTILVCLRLSQFYHWQFHIPGNPSVPGKVWQLVTLVITPKEAPKVEHLHFTVCILNLFFFFFFLRIWTRKGEVLKKWDGQQCSFVSFANVFTTQNKALKFFIPFQVPLLVGHFSSWWRASKNLSVSFRQMGSDSQLAC